MNGRWWERRMLSDVLIAGAATLALAASCGGSTEETGRTGGEGARGGAGTTGTEGGAAGGSAAGAGADGGATGSDASGGVGVGGASTTCRNSSECLVTFLDCCGECGMQRIDRLIAIRVDANEGYRDAVCEPDVGCPECEATIPPSVRALCVGGECKVVDIEPVTRCTVSADCRLRNQDCCECDTVPMDDVVVGISDTSGYEQLACADQVFCAPCNVEYPMELDTECSSGHCRVFTWEFNP